ncbi:MAG: zinc-dependent alcohol dehydrogenase [Hyphomicrobiaceae bacterium]
MSNPTVSRSRGRIRVARSLWYTAPQTVEIRSERLAPAPPGWLTIETHFSAISRGTEQLIWRGGVAESEWQRMRAPFQDGDFPFPVKYGYSAAGIVIDGPTAWIGANTFALFPHQDVFTLPADRVTRLPDGIPLQRATLAANMETALNAVWDSGAGPADKIVIVGAGVVGLLVAYLTARMPGTRVFVVDVAPARRAIVEAFGATFVPADGQASDSLGDDADVVFHTSASAPGLATAVNACGFEASLVELSWYGDAQIGVALGGAFHAKRLRLISSQVGHVAAKRRPRWSHARRLDAAAALLDDPLLDPLVATTVAFDELTTHMPVLLDRTGDGLAPVIAYPAAT